MLLADPVFRELDRRPVTEGRMLPPPVVEFHLFRRHRLAAGATELARRRLDPVAQGLLNQPQFLRHSRQGLPVLHPL